MIGKYPKPLLIFATLMLWVMKQFVDLFFHLSPNRIPKPSSIVIWFLQLRFNNKLLVLEYLCELYRRYGLFRFEDKIYVIDPVLARKVVHKLSKGSEENLIDSPLTDTFLNSTQKYPEIRKVIASLFRKSSLAEKSVVMVRDIDRMCAKLKMETNRDVNMTRWTLRLAVDIVGHVLFGLEFRGLDGQQENLIESIMTIVHKCYALNEISPKSAEFLKADDEFDHITTKVLEEALKSLDGESDQDRLVLRLQKICGFDETKENIKPFLMAGSDTMSATVPTVIWLLTEHPDVQVELREEVDSVIELLRKDVTTSTPRLDAMLKEALRLYPIAPFISRHNDETTCLSNVQIDKNTDIVVFIWGIHRSKELWERPTEFIPRRFLSPGEEVKSNLFIPFGAGARVSGHWSKWSPCSCTCGIGIQVRRRENHYKATVTPTYSLRACVGQTRECTKAYVALSDKRRYSSILKTKTALYKHLGLVAIVIVGVASSVFFICMLAIFKFNKRLNTDTAVRN